ncbi:MAG TPA: hypothetical protein VEY30_08880, partial [Myxococcaceae bacterium]|nr:hypothetical protein [Myxococcaceae bacterium]
PVQRRKMPEGTYRLELRQKGYVNQERTVQIAGGRDVRLVMKLVRAAAPPRPVETRTGLEGSSARDAEAPSPTQASLPTAPQAREPEPAPLVAAAPRTEQAPPAREEPPAPAVTRPAVVAAPAAPVAALPKASGVASDCPDDARPLGAAPPQGHEVWCQLPSGLKHGRATRWYATGQKAEEGEYRNGKKNGRWIEWYENGGERARTEWRKGVKAW